MAAFGGGPLQAWGKLSIYGWTTLFVLCLATLAFFIVAGASRRRIKGQMFTESAGAKKWALESIFLETIFM